MSSAFVIALVQVLVFSAMPFLVYLVRHRSPRGFLRYIGLYRPEWRTLAWAIAIVVLVTPLMLWTLSFPGLREMATGPATTVGLLRRVGLNSDGIVLLFLYAWVQTALAEEILFRGFIAQRLITRFGFTRGNLAQATLFGLVHLALFLALAGQVLTPARMAMLFVVPVLFGWLLGMLKVRLGNGSIVPGWWVHGLGNFASFAILAFVWV